MPLRCFQRYRCPRQTGRKKICVICSAFLPFVGAAVGVVMLGMEWLCRYFGMSNGFIAVALVLVPVIVTGGIHVDGLLDTSDALSSWRDREKRLEILKDSHAGAFAVITACVYFLTMYGGMSQIVEQDNRKMLYILATGYMVSRCLSGNWCYYFAESKCKRYSG